MGTSSIEDVLEHVQSGGLSGVLKDSHDIHCKLGNKTHEILEKYHDEEKEPAAMAKVMSKFKTEFKTMGDDPGCRCGGSYYRWVQYGNQIPLPLPEPVPGSRQRDRSFD